MTGDHRFGQAEALLEFSLLLGMQIVAQVRRDDDVDADEPVGLGPRDKPPGGRPGHPEPNRDLGLGEPIEVVQRRRAQGQPQVFGAGAAVLGRAIDRHGALAI